MFMNAFLKNKTSHNFISLLIHFKAISGFRRNIFRNFTSVSLLYVGQAHFWQKSSGSVVGYLGGIGKFPKCSH